MRILRLRFKNLNSLYGEHLIDFTKPVFRDTGMFAIVGPTGAGKSTILDAICLALFGQTPRQGSITGTTNEVMSRHTGECYAEVEFESNGEIYVAYWEQRRARKKAEGKLQGYNHTLSNAAGEQLNSKESKTTEVVYNTLGLNFEQFKRSVLLAQGSFDSFLKANANEKAEVLKRLTGTELYAEISKEVFQRAKNINVELDTKQKISESIALLSTEEIQELRSERDEISRTLVELKTQIEQLNKQQQHLEQNIRLELELDLLQRQAAEAQKAVEDEAANITRLKQAQLAAQIQESFQQHLQEKRQVDELKIELSALEERLEASRLAQQEQRGVVTAATEVVEASSLKVAELQRLAPIVRKLDKEIEALQHQLNIAQKAQQGAQQRVEQELDALKGVSAQLSQTQSQLATVGAKLTEFPSPEDIQEHSPEWIQALLKIESDQDRLATDEQRKFKLEGEVQELEQEVQNLENDLKVQRERVTGIDEKQSELENNIHALLNGSKRSDLKQLLAQLQTTLRLRERVMKLEDYRAELEDGKECPLCGAVHHPFAHEVPEFSQEQQQHDELLQRLQQLDQLDEKLQELHADSASQKEQVQHCSSQVQILQSRLSDKEHELKNVTRQVKDSSREVNARLEKVVEHLVQCGLDVRAESVQEIVQRVKDVDSLMAQLLHERRDLEKDSQILSESEELIRQRVLGAEKTLDVQVQELKKVETDLETVETQRKNTFPGENIEDALTELQQTHELKQHELSKQEQLLTEFATKSEYTREQLQEKEQQLTELSAEVKTAEPQYVRTLQLAGFTSENELQSASMLPAEREKLQQHLDAMAQKCRSIERDINRVQKQREELRVDKDATNKLNDVQQALQTTQDERDRHLNSLGQIDEKLQQHADRLKQREQLGEEYKQLLDKKEDWDRLDSLIGSSDGARFNRYVQGLTFDILVAHANRHLRKMTDRYVLKRTEGELDLSVIDMHQDSEQRPVSSLSGGESFLVSLSLALGLSAMASKNVTISSLFLDEGFGTLDQQSLEMVLDALSNLQQENKLVGIISHVGALKERILTQIRVVPQKGGRSSLVLP